ncbi:alpha/beta fold hydrolase [Ornithinibacillus sp. L9]|uniref:Alpha/beta fold hydrolase n=1 Tax=Ornithinibacillus caprae TaxID=2678566 RepID=A0A6N8FKH0_9BACI|nr:alpha/beta hydrolase [Ornithinibacillus caprae]MUK88814.1 alpha/beta fold hydrolase [Ornithinibacillus caprae]
MKRKKVLKIVITIITVLLIIDIIAGFYFYNLAISRGQKDFLQGNQDLEVSAEAMTAFTEGGWRKWVREQDFEELEMNSFDDLTLKGYLLEAKEPTNKLVIMAHGYLGSGSQMGLYGQYYYEELGYSFFTADARGHGNSEGDYYGFGWHDRLDYVKWIDLLIEKLGEDTEIVLHGLSMGAATVLMTSGEELPDNVKVVIADSPFTSVQDLFSYQITRMFKLPSFPVLDTTSLVSKAKAGYSFTEASTLEQVKKAERPILYIHGNADTFVPTEMTHELYENTKSEAEMVTFDNANHGEAFVIHEEKYIKVLNEFLNKYMD